MERQPDSSEVFTPNDKTGTFFTASMHIFTAVVGAGVLALPSSVAYLGWVAGPVLIIIFYAVSLMSSKMLADCYDVKGVEHPRYHHAVRHLLSARSAFWVSVFQLLNILLTTIAYTITGATSMQQIAQLACTNPDPDQCVFSKAKGGMWQLVLIFGGVELVLSQVRNLEEAWWVSTLGSIASLIYSCIALIISLCHVSNGEGSVGGIAVGEEIFGGTVMTTAGKVFGILNSLGAIGFAYNFSLILLEIQDTLHQPPKASIQMKKSCNYAITTAFLFYLSVAISGYAAEGNQVAGMILESFTGPVWALIIANAAVLLHMLTAFQVFGQAMFNTIESHVKWRILKRAASKAKSTQATVPPVIAPKAVNAAEQGATLPSPFDANLSENFEKSIQKPQENHKMLGMHHITLEPVAERLSSALSSQIMDQQLSSVLEHLHSMEASVERKNSRNLVSMYAADTGFANEEVPLNEEGWALHFGWRLVIRSAYVLLITLIASIMPFFGAIAGLVGAVTYYPLAIYFPFACYRKVKSVTPTWNVMLWMIWWGMLVVSLSAIVGSVRTIIVSWSTFSIFGT